MLVGFITYHVAIAVDTAAIIRKTFFNIFKACFTKIMTLAV